MVELNESGREILTALPSTRGVRVEVLLQDAPDFRDLVEAVRAERTPVGRREVHWRRGDLEKVLGVTVTRRRAPTAAFWASWLSSRT